MNSACDHIELDRLLAAARSGDRASALAAMRQVRTGRLTFDVEVRVVDAIYEARKAFSSRRIQLALALLCARTSARARARAILLELVAKDYAPAMHFLGASLIEEGRTAAGLRLLDLARTSGYRLGDVAYWKYQGQVARGPKRGWLALRVVVARLSTKRRRATQDETELAFWLPAHHRRPGSET